MTTPARAALIFSCLLSSLALCDEGQKKPVSQRIDIEARLTLRRAQKSQYTHKSFVDEKEGIYNLDCSGFVDLMLKKVSPTHLADIETQRANRKRQLAEDYVAAFDQAPTAATGSWQRIIRVSDAQPGDILCWNNPKHKEGDHLNTGHVMIIDELPVAETHAGQKLYAITVIDSTSSPHSHDTRKDGASGLGRGTLWLSVDAEGRPIGYHWKTPTGRLHECTVVIGKAVDKSRTGSAP